MRASARHDAPFRPAPAVACGWRLLGPADHPVAAGLPRGTDATAVLLGAEFRPADNALLLAAVAAAARTGGRLVLVHQGAGGGSLLRVAAREDPGLRVGVVELPAVPTRAAVAAATAAMHEPEARVDARGRVTRTAWHEVALPGHGPLPGGAVLVTGGARGLGLRAALVLARVHGWRPVVVDVAEPGRADRLASARAVVVRADVRDRDAVRAALATSVTGPVRAVVHCAGVLVAGQVARSTPADLARAQSAKVAGLRAVLDVVDARELRHLVVFGSVTAHDPHRGMGAYGLANELLRRSALSLATRLPNAATTVAEWALWSGAGMAHEMGAVAQARRMGMTPIPLRAGMDALLRLLHRPAGPAHATAIRLD
ncbi:SDR family NAD(P)-dependent oxidoreductase [Saccharothrix obliqua]|uniref:SDR family NAD(P)-dependent oxidoreductase n=1 Tax=Saccharothrix obliqua TaxID=2861747 RepID=UPI001C5F9769|nr:SDR family NAD(P)-dependent oxidoreductase [Saccharothrix obliqua]MBW4721440.1 SDR family NAD(P)-dependent oxidoreductase [Saccharothrix obliqua]